MSSIDTGANYIGSMLRDGKPYVVPNFQRNFSWKNEQVEQFWDDLFNALKNTEDSYFLGSIVINDSDKSSYSLIDGKQRITTISILLCALRDIAKLKNSEKLANQINSDLSSPQVQYHLLTEFRGSVGACRGPDAVGCGCTVEAIG